MAGNEVIQVLPACSRSLLFSGSSFGRDCRSGFGPCSTYWACLRSVYRHLGRPFQFGLLCFDQTRVVINDEAPAQFLDADVWVDQFNHTDAQRNGNTPEHAVPKVNSSRLNVRHVRSRNIRVPSQDILLNQLSLSQGADALPECFKGEHIVVGALALSGGSHELSLRHPPVP
jgi:hypothetical protein